MTKQQTPQIRVETRRERAAARLARRRRTRIAQAALSMVAILGLVIPTSAIASTFAAESIGDRSYEFRDGTVRDAGDAAGEGDAAEPTPLPSDVSVEPVREPIPFLSDAPAEPVVVEPSDSATPTPAPEGTGGAMPAPSDAPGEEQVADPADDAAEAPVSDDAVALAAPDGTITPMTIPTPTSSQAVITVKVSGDRLPDGTVQGLQGVVLDLYRGTPTQLDENQNRGNLSLKQGTLGSRYTDSWATCTSDAAGDCSFVIPIGNGTGQAPRDTRFWVVQRTAPDGWYLNPTMRIGSNAATPELLWQYRFQTGTRLRGGETYSSQTAMTWTSPPGAGTVPSNPTGDDDNPGLFFMRNRVDSNKEGWYNQNVTRTTGVWSVSRENPPTPTACAMKIALIADTSGSLYEQGMIDLKRSMTAFVDAFRGTPTEMALFSFSNVSPGSNATANNPNPMPVGTPTQAQTFKQQYATWAPGGGTNWDRGFAAAANAAPTYDLAVLLTDGNPTVIRDNSGVGSSAYNSLQDVDAGIFSANQLKAEGTHVIALGVGPQMTNASVNNLRAVSGTTPGDDYLKVTDWDALIVKLKELATQNCNSSIGVEKMIIPPGGTVADALPAPAGWEFSASTSAPGLTVSPATQVTNGNGVVDFGLKFTTPPQTGAVSIVETQQPGYDLVPVGGKNAVCKDAESGAAVPVTNVNSATKPGLTVTAAAGKRIECKVYNRLQPTTVSVHKDLPDGRALTGDQFTLQLNSATGQSMASATTTGNVDGVQTEHVAPTLVQVGATYQLAEIAGTGTTNLASYLTTLACTIDGGGAVVVTPTPTTGNQRATFTVPQAALGKNISCLFTNTPPTLTVKKDIVERFADGDQFTLEAATTGSNPTTIGTATTSGSTTGVQTAQIGPVNVGVGSTYTVREVGAGTTNIDTYGASLECRVDGGTSFFTLDSSSGDVVIPAEAAGKNVTCTFTNTAHPHGSVMWQKVANSGSTSTPEYEPLAGSVFKIVGPAPSTAELIVEDCGATLASQCAEYTPDTDKRHGYLNVPGLAWGEYQLIEVQAPAGYMVDATPRPFTIGMTDPAQLDWDLGPIINRQIDVPTIPLTGGASEDAFMIAAGGVGAIVLLTLMVQYVRTRNRREIVPV